MSPDMSAFTPSAGCICTLSTSSPSSLKKFLRIATTTGNSKSPRLGVAMVIRSARSGSIAPTTEIASAKSTKQPTRARNNRRHLFMRSPPLFQPHIFAEVVLGRILALEPASNLVFVPFAGETFFQKRHHQTPRVLGRFFAVTPRHGVVKPAVRGAGIDTDVTILLGFFQGIAKSHDVVDGNNMVRLAENT